LTVSVAKLDDMSAEFFRNAKDARNKYEQLVSQDEELNLAVTTSTGNLARVRSRYEIIQKYLDELIY